MTHDATNAQGTPGGVRPPPSPKAAPVVTEGRGPKAGTVNRPAAIVPPPEKAGQPPLVLGGTRSDGTFVTLRGEPLPAVPKPKEGSTAARNIVIPKAMPTDADTWPNNVSAERQAITMRTMFQYIDEAHREYGTPLSNYPCAEQGEYIDPEELPLNSFNRADQYVWAVLRARNSPEIIRDNFTCLVLPHLNTERGFIQCGQAEVMWFLRGWNFYERDSTGQYGWRY